MKTTKVNWNVKKLSRMYENGSINFDYPIQRAGNQWDDLQKSLLIHSIAGDYPVPPVLILNSGDIDYVLDGKQRITNIIDFVFGVKNKETGEYPASAYSLHDETPNVKLDEVEEEYELAGKYFDELHEDIQREILGVTLSISRLEEATDDEITELFYRWNNGTPLTKQQKARAKMGIENASIINVLQKHPFLKEKVSFTKLQRRRSDDEAVILQSMMLLDEDYEIESFVADKLLNYAKSMKDKDITGLSNKLESTLDYANSSIETTNALLKKLHLPTVIYVANIALNEGVEPEVFGAWVEDFNKAINERTRDKALVKTNYKSFTGAGSVKKHMVLGRKEAMVEHFNEFVKKYEPLPEVTFETGNHVTVEDENIENNAENTETEVNTDINENESDVAVSNVEVDTVEQQEEISQEEQQEGNDVKEGEVEEVFAGIDEVIK